MLNNFNHDKRRLKSSEGPERGEEVRTLLENGKITLYDAIHQKGDMIWKIFFSQNVCLIILNNIYHHKHCLKDFIVINHNLKRMDLTSKILLISVCMAMAFLPDVVILN